jgi:hypothetical protein
VFRFIAEQRGVDLRTVRRWCETGKIPNAYRTRHGWRFRRLPPDEVEVVIRLQNAALLRQFKAQLFPRFDEEMELAYVEAGITNPYIAAVRHPDPVQRKRNIEMLRHSDPQKWHFLCCGREMDLQEYRRREKLLEDPNVKLAVKARILRTHGYDVTRENLSKMLCISTDTLRRNYDREVLRRLCRPVAVRSEELDKECWRIM